jgi:D-beta-D-heptose 7-phosphate kinase/D-beta-D-heptose 1-phosphate adenosyltransferase
MNKKTICLSGGMDPIHIGHVRMILNAAKYGDVIVILNSDDWLLRKKGYCFMPFEERKEILLSIKGVIEVSSVNDDDGTVCEALKRIKPNYFGNGGDRRQDNTPEGDICRELGIEMIWNLGGEKIQSSSELVKNTKSEEK